MHAKAERVIELGRVWLNHDIRQPPMFSDRIEAIDGRIAALQKVSSIAAGCALVEEGVDGQEKYGRAPQLLTHSSFSVPQKLLGKLKVLAAKFVSPKEDVEESGAPAAAEPTAKRRRHSTKSVACH